MPKPKPITQQPIPTTLAGMKASLAKLEKYRADREKWRWDNRIFEFKEGGIWQPNPQQARLLEAFKNPQYKTFTMTGSNQKGKCVTYPTLIETPNGEVAIGKLFEIGKPFDVYAWDGMKKVIAKATAPFKKDGIHKCYRITMADGRFIEAADHHRILLADGRYVSTKDLFYTYSQSLLLSNSDTYLSVLPSGAVHLSEKQLGCLDGCSDDRHQYDGILLSDRGSDQVPFPLQADVQQHNDFCGRKGGRASKYANNLLSRFFRQSSLDDLGRNVGQVVGYEYRNACRILTSYLEASPLSLQPSIVGISGSLSGHEVVQHPKFSFCSYGPPLGGVVNRIEGITPIDPCQVVYDFSVPEYKNYYAGGLVHHNTLIGLAIAICYMAGEWLWSGEKIPFPHKEPRIVTYTGQGWETHIKKTIEPDLKILWPKSRPVHTSKNNQGIEDHWIDLQSKSELFIMSNNQESIAFEGDKADLRIWDEPPKRANRVAAGRGLMARNGRELFVATNLDEAWFQREVIKSTDPSVFHVHGAIWDNVSKCKCGEYILREEIVNNVVMGYCGKCGPVIDYTRYGLTVEGVERYKSTIKEHEIRVRIDGESFTSETLVLPAFKREIHCIDRFPIPLNWIVDVSIDFHPSKPWAVLFEATGPQDFHYMCDFIHEKGNPKYIAEEIVRRSQVNGYHINSITIDPLSKGDENAHIEAQTVFKTMEKVFRAYNYRLETASKDKDNGIVMLNESFKSENGMPSRYIFRDMGVVIEQFEDWMYDPETYKPSKENDDFDEVAYRIALRNTKWFDPYDRQQRLSRLPAVDFGEVRI